MKEMNVFILSAAVILYSGCDQAARDYLLEGSKTVTCDTSKTVTTNIRNHTNQLVEVNFCSDSYAISRQTESLRADSKIETYSTVIVAQYETVKIPYGDTCSMRNKKPEIVGNQYPIIGALDLAKYKFCFNPSYIDNLGAEMQLYEVEDISNACEPGFQTFDQTTVICK